MNQAEWCNCQAIPGTRTYPGPWHPRGDESHYPCSQTPDWHRIAVQIARYGGSYYGLKTWERDLLEAEVAAENERDWGTNKERTVDAAERGECS